MITSRVFLLALLIPVCVLLSARVTPSAEPAKPLDWDEAILRQGGVGPDHKSSLDYLRERASGADDLNRLDSLVHQLDGQGERRVGMHARSWFSWGQCRIRCTRAEQDGS